VSTQQPLAVISNGMVGCVVWADSHEHMYWALNVLHTHSNCYSLPVDWACVRALRYESQCSNYKHDGEYWTSYPLSL